MNIHILVELPGNWNDSIAQADRLRRNLHSACTLMSLALDGARVRVESAPVCVPWAECVLPAGFSLRYDGPPDDAKGLPL